MKQDWEDAGFYKDHPDTEAALQQLNNYIDQVPSQYLQLPKDELLLAQAPGKWSKKQVLGHLIDSAINNLKRFSDCQLLPEPYIVAAYRQDQLVTLNNYQALPLDHLLQLWVSVNRQIVFLLQNTDPEKLDTSIQPQYDNRALKNLSWLVCDYVSHMTHHFKTVL
jgi:hypothetical protein